MIIDCISDLHGFQPKLQGGDLLIVAGDLTAKDSIHEYAKFFGWLKKQDYENKVLIAGNHDGFMAKGWPQNEEEAKDCAEIREFLDEGKEDFHYLCDSSCQIGPFKIWGSPWSLWFHGINPLCTAFTGHEHDLANKFCKIPRDTDILVTHTPPNGILDYSGDRYLGSHELRSRVLSRRLMPKLKLHVFGHIHEMGGCMFETTLSTFVNAAIMDESYKPTHKPRTVEL